MEKEPGFLAADECSDVDDRTTFLHNAQRVEKAAAKAKVSFDESVGSAFPRAISSPMPALTPAPGHGHILFACGARIEPRLHIMDSLFSLLSLLPRYCCTSRSLASRRLLDITLYVLPVVLAKMIRFSARASPFRNSRHRYTVHLEFLHCGNMLTRTLSVVALRALCWWV